MADTAKVVYCGGQVSVDVKVGPDRFTVCKQGQETELPRAVAEGLVKRPDFAKPNSQPAKDAAARAAKRAGTAAAKDASASEQSATTESQTTGKATAEASTTSD